MVAVIVIILGVILAVEFIIGNISNGFIALVNSLDWIKKRKMKTCDQILTALAISRLGMLWSVFLPKLIFAYYPALEKTKKVSKIMHNSRIVSNHFSIWFATSLSIFYFLKIAMFSNSAFLYFKWRAKKVLTMTMLVSLGLLFSNIALSNMKIDLWFKGYKENKTSNSSLGEFAQAFWIFLFTDTVFMMIPFTVSLVTFLLLIFSLWRHLRRMQLSAVGSRDASSKAHFRCLQTMIVFLVLCSIFFFSLLLQIWSFALKGRYLITMVSQVFSISYPSGHSCVLILTNNKLRQASLHTLCWLQYRLKCAGSTFHLPPRRSSLEF